MQDDALEVRHPLERRNKALRQPSPDVPLHLPPMRLPHFDPLNQLPEVRIHPQRLPQRSERDVQVVRSNQEVPVGVGAGEGEEGFADGD